MARATTANTAARISAAALRILERQGAAAVSMRRVAAAVGITPMAIYHHFPNREALLRAVTDAEFGRLLDFLLAARDRAADPLQRLVEMMIGYIDYALARPRLLEYVFAGRRPGARRFPDDFRARRSPTLTPVADTIAEAMNAGRLRRGDEWETALDLWALCHGYAVFYLGGRISLPPAELRELVRRALWRTIDGLRD